MTAVAPFIVSQDAARAREAMEKARSLVAPALRSAVERLGPELRPIVCHHISDGGKYVRAALVLSSARAVGADESVAMPGAVAVELVHNFSLLHDDIIDGDLERRHRPTVWARYGVGNAIIAGDALATLAFQVLLEDPSRHRALAAVRLAEATQAMISGQAEDMASESRRFFSVEECLTMEAGKTAALLSCAASLGAVLADAKQSVVVALAEFGLHLGVAFQAVDDVLGIWGDPAVTGKPVGNDLRQHKKTLPVVIAMSRGGATLAALSDVLGGDLSDGDVAKATRLLEESGAREETMAVGESNLAAALDALRRLPLELNAAADLAAIARFVTARDR
jgi:geranylgeranyl diphosphate synthase, type I